MEPSVSSCKCIPVHFRAVGRPSAFREKTHVACQWAGFTLLEMIAVIGIIAILMGLLAPMVHRARRSARQADCRSNLRQFGIALTVYRADHNGRNPDWMSSLYPEPGKNRLQPYIDAPDVYVCKSDQKRGKGPNMPDILTRNPYNLTAYPETVDNDSVSRHSAQNSEIQANSYFYEFSAADAPAGWGTSEMDADGDGRVAWWEYKEHQLRYGDTANGGTDDKPVPYSASRMPIIRCWHHFAETRTTGFPRNSDGTRSTKLSYNQPLTLNVAYAGNVFTAPPWWEGRAEPGEK